jgi:CRISPR type III-B/RAMP module RAMP protein Cmr1
MAEVRPASIRGKLRWWFRVLGGTIEQESEVFGGVHGVDGKSSGLILRVKDVDISSKWQPLQVDGNSNKGYLLYFAKASGDGVRWQTGGALPEGCSFELQLLWSRTVAADTRAIFDLAMDCFLMLGSFGLRATRGLGAFSCKHVPFSEASFATLISQVRERAPHFIAEIAEFSGPRAQILDALGAQLRGLRADCSAVSAGRSNPSPLGSSIKPRQTSAVYLRPVREAENRFRLIVFEAPAEKVLGDASRNQAPLLGHGVPPPGHAPSGGFGRSRRY